MAVDSYEFLTFLYPSPPASCFIPGVWTSGLRCQKDHDSMCAQLISQVWLFVTPWTVASQAPLSMEFSRLEYWRGLPFLLQEIFLTQGSNPCLLASPVLAGRFFPTETLGIIIMPVAINQACNLQLQGPHTSLSICIWEMTMTLCETQSGTYG